MNAIVPRALDGEVLGPSDVTVILHPHPFKWEHITAHYPAGDTVAEIVRDLGARHVSTRMDVDYHVALPPPEGERKSWVIPQDKWHRVRPKPGTSLYVRVVPSNLGNGVGRSLIGLAITIAAITASAVFAPYLIPYVSLGLGLSLETASVIVPTALTAAFTIGGTLAFNALFPVRPAQLPGGTSSAESPTYSISGARNQAVPFGSVPVILGTHRISPPWAARPYTEIVGPDQYLRLLLTPGYGPLDISEIKIGETAIADFDDVEMEIREGYDDDDPITLYPAQVFQEDLNIQLKFADGFSTRTTAEDVDEFSIDITFPSGLIAYDGSTGQQISWPVYFTAEYRETGSMGSWITIFDSYVQDRSKQPTRRGYRVVPAARGQYDVRIKRSNAEYNGNGQAFEDIYWTALRGVRNEHPINFPKPLALIALRIRATSQLSGVVDTLNCIAKPRMKAWNGSSWVDDQTSQNPADLFRYVLQHPANARPVPDALLDLPTLQEWHAYCVSKGFKFNQVRDFKTSVKATVDDIAAAGRASVLFRDGKWSVYYDQPDDEIVDHISPRVSWDYSATRLYKHAIHAWRIPFINELKGYARDERIVYDDGYNSGNATLFESIEFPGVTHPDLIWKHGRFHIAQIRLRPEEYVFSVDWQSVRYTRGDRVRVSHDVPLFGQDNGRVKAVDGQIITLDNTISMVIGNSYVARFILSDGSELLRSVLTDDNATNTFTLTGGGDVPAVGDHCMFGILNNESATLRIKNIQQQRDLTARISCVDDAPAISTADAGTIPDFDSHITAPANIADFVPRNLRIVENHVAIGNTFPDEVVLTWQPPQQLSLGLRIGSQFQISRYDVQYKDNTVGVWVDVPANQITLPNAGADLTATVRSLPNGSFDFRVRTVLRAGNQPGALLEASRWVTVTSVAILGPYESPGDVQNFQIAILGDNANLTWDAVTSPQLDHYEIRYSSALVDVTWGSAIPLLTKVVGTSAQIPVQPGTYLIKAISKFLLESPNATLIVTESTGTTQFNAVETITEDPAFDGTKDDVIPGDPDGIQLDYDPSTFEVVPEGYYYFDGTIDLLDVYTSRLTGSMTAVGLNLSADFFSPPDFFSVPDFFQSDPAGWNATIEVRPTVDDPGGSPVWSEWAPLTVSNYRARAFEFRAHLQSFVHAITPLITALAVTVDMPDRIVTFKDVALDAGGTHFDIDPPFLALKAVIVNWQDMATGDYGRITNKDVDGFDARVFNSSNTGIPGRSVDVTAIGYGRVIS